MVEKITPSAPTVRSKVSTGYGRLDPSSIPILDHLIQGGIRPGTIFAVEYDPDSQWIAVATTIAARYLQEGCHVAYVSELRPLEHVKHDLAELGADVMAYLNSGQLYFYDYYSATLAGGRIEFASGQGGIFEPIPGGLRVRSLKVADLSVQWLRESKYGHEPYDVVETWPPGSLAICDSASEMLRFNDENAFAEYAISRVNPNERKAGRINLTGFVRGMHTDSFYKRIENAVDGVIDVRVLEEQKEPKNFLRIRTLKGQRHDALWHQIEVKQNGEACLSS